MYTLLTFPASFGMPSHSPFCVKAMVLLNLAEVDWVPEYLFDPRKMPLGRLPVLQTGAHEIADSEHIQNFLEAQGHDLWAGKGDKARNKATPLIRMAESVLLDALVQERWFDDRCWPEVRKAFFSDLPRPLRAFLPGQLRKKMLVKQKSIGFAQFSPDERLARTKADLDAVEALLWDNPFLLGDAPTPADASVAPMLAMIESLPAATALREELRGRAPLMGYIARMRPHFAVPTQSMAKAA